MLLSTRAASLLALAARLAACGGQPQEEESGPTAAVPTAETAVAETPSAESATSFPAPAASTPPAFAQCQSCHSATPGQNGIGPSLAGVFGTKAAEVPDYDFSDAMKKSGLTWDEATLDRYLTSPQTVVPGTKMTFPGLKDNAKRAATIAFLKSIQ
jgi:cytochrome c2